MYKRMVSLALALSMCMGLMVPAFAAEDPTTVLSEEEEFIAENYTAVTKSFEESNAGIDTLNNEEDDPLNYYAAIDFVKSLELDEYPDIEEACLGQLKSIAESGGVIAAYTVYIPKERAGERASLSTFGTYNGRKFYYTIYGTGTYDLEKNTQQNQTIIGNFVSGAISVIVGFLGNKYSIPFTVLQSALSLPSGYTAKNINKIEMMIRVTANLRGIYTQDDALLFGNDRTSYVRVCTDEKGTARPFSRVACPTWASQPEISNWVGESVSCTTTNYNNKTTMMAVSEEYYYSGTEHHYYLKDIVGKNAEVYWQS